MMFQFKIGNQRSHARTITRSEECGLPDDRDCPSDHEMISLGEVMSFLGDEVCEILSRELIWLSLSNLHHAQKRIMRLLTHNTMRNNTKEADGKGYPLKITAVEVKVVDNPEAAADSDKEIAFVRHVLPTLEWRALVQVGSIVQLFFEYWCFKLIHSTVYCSPGCRRDGNQHASTSSDRGTRRRP